MDPTSESAKQLFEEWKYRHEMFYKTLHRYGWFYIVLALLPSFALVVAGSKLKDYVPHIEDFLSKVRKPGWAHYGYWLVILIFFLGTTWHLSVEHRYVKGAEGRMSPELRPTKGEFWDTGLLPLFFWMVGWLVFFTVICFIIR